VVFLKKWSLKMSNKYTMVETSSRGFFSVVLTILTTYDNLIRKDNISPEDIYLSPELFGLYGGNPLMWFDIKNYGCPENSIIVSCLDRYYLSENPTSEEMNFDKYLPYIPFNERINKLIEEKTKDISDCFGLHYRATDHPHAKDFSFYIDRIELYFNPEIHKKVFLCTDDANIIPTIKEWFKIRYGIDEIIYHDSIRSSNGIPIHYNHNNTDRDFLISIADNVILDSVSLSKCSVVVGLGSNLSNFAQIMNRNLRLNRINKEEGLV